MKYLIYTETPLNDGEVQHRLRDLDTSAVVRVMVPVRELTEAESQFLRAEHATDQVGTSPEEVSARWRLREAVASLHLAGFEAVDGWTIPGSPVDAIESEVEAGRYDAVVVVTGPTGVAGWVNLDLAHRVERHVDKPVTHIEFESAPNQ
jgi:hypothetical protein